MRLHAGMSLRVATAIIVVLMGLLGLAAARAGATPLTEFKLPSGTDVGALIDGGDGNMYFGAMTSTGTPEIGRITTAGKITYITTGFDPGAQIHDLTLGANGVIWFSDIGTTKALGKLVLSSGKVTEVKAGKDGLDPGAVPYDLAAASNGTVWFEDSDNTTPGVGAISASGQISEYPDESLMPIEPRELTTDAAGNAWFTRQGETGIGEAKLGAPTGTPVSMFSTGATMANGIVAGDDGKIWWTGNGDSVIGRLTPSDGTDTQFSNGLHMNATPDAIDTGPGGDVWFDDQSTKDGAGYVTPAGKISEFNITGTPWDLTEGIDGNVWVTQGDNNGIDRITPAGKVSFFSAGLDPGVFITDNTNVIVGPDGDLWTQDLGTPNAIIRADVQLPPTATTGASSSAANTAAQIAGTVNPRGAATTAAVQYGTSPSLGKTASAGSLAEANVASPVSATLTGLPSGTKIYYRVSATNAYGTVTGTTQSFTTKGSSSGPPSSSGTRTVHTTVGDQQITLTLPSATTCLAAKGKLALKLGSTAIADSKAATLRFKQAAAFIDRGVKRTHSKVVVRHHHKHRVRVTVFVPNAKAGHVPATLKLALPGLKSGSHSLRVRLTYTRTRHAHHHTVHSTVIKTIKLRFKIC